MQDKEFTQICREILAVAEKIVPLPDRAKELLQKIEKYKDELQKTVSDANEQATQTLSAAQSQAEQTAKLAKEATAQNAASAKSAQQKAAEILTSIEKLQEQIKATADKVENAGALLTELNSLKEQIKTLLQSGIINDTAQSAIQTYSSNLIERKLATKASAEYGYSKIEANAKFETLAQGINTAIGAAAAAQSSAAGKLGKDEKAADSAKLGGVAAKEFMRKDVYKPDNESSANSLVLRDSNGDFAGRYLRCGHVELQAPTQDSLMGTTSELIFRNAEDKYERATSIVRVLQCLNSVQNDVAWMDSDAITPDNKNQVGYARLPGGLIIQFGMTHRLAPGEARTQIFPVAFPHACFVVLCSPHLPLPDNGLLSPYTQGWGTTTCTVKNVDSDSSCHIAWIAIGN